MSEPRSLPFRRDIDGLRAVAVLLVIVHHVAPPLMPGGFVGVDVFFVISGYLMTRILDAGMRDGTYRYVAFIWRRCRRIVPPLATVLAATLVAGMCVLTGPELTSLGRHLFAGALSASNLLLWSEVGYFDTSAAVKPLLHLWSLGVEEQFYLLWPLLLGALPTGRRERLLCVVAIVAFSLLVSEDLAYSDPSQAFYLLHSRAWELGVGAVLAMLLERHGGPWQSARPNASALQHRDVVSLVGTVMVLVAALRIEGTAAWPGINALLPVLGTALVIAAGPDALLNRTILASGAAQWVGTRSYALYLWHWPPLAFLAILAQENAWAPATVQWVAVALMIPAAALAHATLHLVERPAQLRATGHAQRGQITVRHLRPYALALGALALVALTVIGTKGLPIRYATAAIDATAALREASPDSITTYDRVATRCHLADEGHATWCWRIPGDGRGVAVFGDSHAEVLFAGLASQRVRSPLFLTGRKGCAPIVHDSPQPERTSEICRRATALAHEAIRSDTALGTVLLVSRGPAYMSGVGFGVDSLRPVVAVAPGDSTALHRAFERGMERSIRSLQASGKRVILVMATPELGFRPDECIIGRPFGLRRIRHPCALPRPQFVRRNAEYRLLVSRLQARLPALEVFETEPLLCDARACRAERDGHLLYSDGNHLTRRGSQLIARQLGDVLAAPRASARVAVRSGP